MHFNNLCSKLFVISLCCLNTTVSAELLIDPAEKNKKGKVEVGSYFTSSTVTYSVSTQEQLFSAGINSEVNIDNGSYTLDIKRQILSAYYSYGFHENVDVFVAGGFILNSESSKTSLNSYNDSMPGSRGAIFSVGTRGILNQTVIQNTHLHWYAQLLMIWEDYGNEWTPKYQLKTVESSQTDLSFGMIAEKPISETFSLYGGVELALYSDGDYEYSEVLRTTSGNYLSSNRNGSIERDGSFGLRLGIKKTLFNVPLNFNIGLANEISFSVGVNIPFGELGNSPLFRDAESNSYRVKTAPVEQQIQNYQKRAVEVAVVPESELNLDQSETLTDQQMLVKVQARLQELGYNPGPADGLMGRKTKSAIGEYQKNTGLEVTYSLDETFLKSLGIQ